MTETVSNPTEPLTKGKISVQDSVFSDEPLCTLQSGGDTEQVDDIYAMYEHIGKLRGAFQKDITSRHPWFPVLEELVRTEDQYLSDINSILTEYVPLFQSMETKIPEIITSTTTDRIFINLEEIRDFHNDFSQSLRPTLGDSSLQRVGKLFQEQADRFKIYSKYCANHSKSVELLVKLSKHKAVDVSLKSIQTKLQHPLNLSTYLLKPVQRVLKYKLLLESLLKHTKEDNDERALLRTARERMDSIAKEINELTAVSECKQLLEEIQEGLDHTPFQGCLTDYGNINLQDTMLDLKAARSRQERLVLLLDKALLICKVREKPKRGGTTGRGLKGKRNAPYKFKDFIRLTELTFTQDDHIRMDDKAFLVHKQTSKQISTYCLKAKSLVKKNHWVSTLQDQVVASFNFEPDMLEQIMNTLKHSTQSLNNDSDSPLVKKRSLSKYKHLISVSPSTGLMLDCNDSFDAEDDKRPYSMYASIEDYPCKRDHAAEAIYCEKSEFENAGEECDKLKEQLRKYSTSLEKRPRPRLPTPIEQIKESTGPKERDSGILDSREYSNSEVKQQMRDLLCTMQQDYSTFHDSTRERDSGVEEGDAPAQLDYLSIKRKHEGLVNSLVKNYMDAVSQQNQKSNRTEPAQPLILRESPDLGDKLNFSKITPVNTANSEKSQKPPLSPNMPRFPKPPLSPKPPVSPKPSNSNKKSNSPSSQNKSLTLPRIPVSTMYGIAQQETPHTKTSTGSNTTLSPSDMTPSPGGNKVSGMKNQWEKTITAHREECKK